MDRSLICATGKALAMIACLLHRGGIATPAEFSHLLGALAATNPAGEPAQRDILRSWSEVVANAGELDRGIMLASGEALAAIGCLLDRGGVLPLRETGDLTGLYAYTVAETHPQEGDILAYWAAIVRDSAPPASSE